jgi:hypothetical protein
MDRKLSNRAARRVQQADSIAVPFELRGFDGLVTLDRLANEDPQRWGYRLLDHFPMEQPLGFPVMWAWVSSPAKGYRAAMGWIQLVYYGEEIEEREVAVDQTPSTLTPTLHTPPGASARGSLMPFHSASRNPLGGGGVLGHELRHADDQDARAG